MITNKRDKTETGNNDLDKHSYAPDCTKLRRKLGWEPATDFEQGLAATISEQLGKNG